MLKRYQVAYRLNGSRMKFKDVFAADVEQAQTQVRRDLKGSVDIHAVSERPTTRTGGLAQRQVHDNEEK